MRSNNALSPLSRIRLVISLVMLLFLLSVAVYNTLVPPSAHAAAADVFFSEYIEGSSFNKALEIYNGTGAPVDLGAGNYVLQLHSNGSATVSQSVALTGVIADGDVFVIAHASANPAILAHADATNSSVINHNGDDAFVLRKGGAAGAVVDSIGQVGVDPGAEWGSGLASTADNTIRRKSTVCQGDTNHLDAYDPAPEWDGFANDTFDGLGSHTANCGGGVSLSVNNVSHDEGDSGGTTYTFTVSLSGPAPEGGVTFDIETADGSATIVDDDYESLSLIGESIPEGSQSKDFEVTVNGDISIEPNETFFVNVTNVSGASLADGQGLGTIVNDDCPAPAADIVISQIYGAGGNANATLQSDFIELYNRGNTTVNLSGWSVQYTSATGTGAWQVTPLTGSIAPGGYYLIQESTGTGCSGSPCGAPLPSPDVVGTILMAAGAGKVALSSSTTAFSGDCPTCPIDLVGYGTTASCFEGAGPTGNLSATTAALRKRGGCFDSNNNNVDFSVGSPNPRNTASQTRTCEYIAAAIHDIQGNGLTTPFLGQDVSTTGIVTGRKSNGFFIQAADAGVDADPNTSEGLFVFTSLAPVAAVGDAVSIKGTASEFFNLTQLESTLPGDVTVNSSGNPLPTPITLTTTILNPAGLPDQLERFEGMRMHADTVVSVAPTNNFGEIFTVLNGVARPVREPGIEISFTVPPDPTSGEIDCCIPRWDENPERIMIDSDGLVGSSVISVTSNVTITNITGPLDFTFGDYKVLPETPPPVTTANMSAVPVPTPTTGEFTVAGFNIENFNNNPTQRKKAALAIRDVLHLPDIIGTIEIFDLADLQALAAEIQTISGVTYEARLIEADGASEDNDQDVGFLVKNSVQIDSVTQEELAGCDGTAANCNTFIDPNTFQPALLNDRPPLTLRATMNPSDPDPLEIIVVVNHTRSFNDIEDLGAEGKRVREKRKAQAEFLATLLQDLQTNNPTTPIMSIGDYNAYQFSDGFTDPVATIKGTPTPDDQIVVDESPDLVDPNFINLTDGLTADQRYSFIFEGTPQAIDHFIINTVAQSLFRRYAIARNNSDFPELPGSLFSGDATRPERNSDHDMPVAYFNFPPTITLSTDPITLFPPNHAYRTVTISDMVVSANDPRDPSLDINDVVIAQVTSDELENAPGSTDGNTLDDIVIAADCKSVQLRAERDGTLDGRVYTVTLKVTDAFGFVTTATRKVTVPISPGAGDAIDSGPIYTVSGGCP